MVSKLSFIRGSSVLLLDVGTFFHHGNVCPARGFLSGGGRPLGGGNDFPEIEQLSGVKRSSWIPGPIRDEVEFRGRPLNGSGR